MKTKFYWVALLVSAAMIAQAKAGGHHGGGGGTFGAPAGPARAAAPSFYSAPGRNFGGGRMIYSGQRFSSVGMRSPSAAAFRQHYINANAGTPIGPRQFTRGSINGGDRLTRFSNGANQAIIDPRGQVSGTRQVRRGNNLPAGWQNHIVAQHSADWQSNWDRSRDHWWHGHRCRFVNGSWFIFDFGFDPWWPYWYPYDYYAYDYYPYGYGPGDYDYDAYQGGEYYDQSGYADQYSDSTIASAQERLAQQGYYRGAIDGILGRETRRAIVRYQGDHDLRVTGYLTTDTLQALGLRRVASN